MDKQAEPIGHWFSPYASVVM